MVMVRSTRSLVVDEVIESEQRGADEVGGTSVPVLDRDWSSAPFQIRKKNAASRAE